MDGMASARQKSTPKSLKTSSSEVAMRPFEQKHSTLAIISHLQAANLTTFGYFVDVGRQAYVRSLKRQCHSMAIIVHAFLPLFMWPICTFKAETFVILHTSL
jgi:hypothetical protein